MTQIEWTDVTWNPIRARNVVTGKTGWHCEHASEGCRNCYAERMNVKAGASGGTGLAYKPGHLGKQVELFLDEKALLAPLRWRKGRRVFVCSMTDLFADFVPDAWIDRIMAMIALCPQHQVQVLTKRSARMRGYFAGEGRTGRIARAVLDLAITDPKLLKRPAWPVCSLGDIDEPVDVELFLWPLPNLWLGVSVEDQGAADARIPDLLATPAALRFLSCEPLLGEVDLELIPIMEPPVPPVPRRDLLKFRVAELDLALKEIGAFTPALNCLRLYRALADHGFGQTKIDWVICGGESGKDARPMHPDWARGLRDQCAAAWIPFFFKQWGEWAPSRLDPGISYAEGSGIPDIAWPDGQIAWGTSAEHGGLGHSLRRPGRKAAGRVLDGVTHDAMPFVARFAQSGGQIVEMLS